VFKEIKPDCPGLKDNSAFFITYIDRKTVYQQSEKRIKDR